jgi:hypothetical protein
MRQILLLAMVVGAFHGALGSQAALTPEPRSAWLYFKEIRAPRPPAGLTDFVLDVQTLDQARANQEDLRLYDSAGREVPYVLRVLRDVATTNAFPAREFNRSADGGIAQISLDLGERTEPHNQVEIDTAGNNFRRLVDVQGSADGAQWSTLASAAIIFRFAAGGHSVEQQAVDYPASRYRYLRVRVTRDPQPGESAVPVLLGVRVRRSVHLAGEMTSTVGNMEARDADRANARPASLWRVDLSGRIPIQQVLLNVGDGVFSRPFTLEAVDDPASPVLLASGELTRRESTAVQLKVGFEERWARRLRLTVVDDRNPPLSIYALTAEGAARQVVFDGASVAPGVMRLYYGSARALAPRYDLAARVPAESGRVADRLGLGPQRDNPAYRPDPKPFSERSPWLVYIVLAAAGIVLAAILVSLARASAASAPAGQSGHPQRDPSDPVGS